MNKHTLFFSVILCTLLLAILPANAHAKGKKSSSALPRAKAAVVDTNDRITALSLTSVIITVYATHQSKEYKVTPATKFSVNGRPATLNDLTTGLDVVVTTLPNDATTASIVDAKTPARWQKL
jgi:hypothetical protein